MSDGTDVLLVPEDVCAELVDRAAAFEAVEAVFAAMFRNEAGNFPVVREALGHAGAVYGFKSGFDRAGLVLGLKSGGYWPGNAAQGLTNHQSTVVLFDPDTGRCKALVGGNLLTALRTAAASAVSIRHLARTDSRVLGIVGAGHQSRFQLRAALDQRNFEQVVAWNRNPQGLDALQAVAAEAGVAFRSVGREEIGREADVIVTITSAAEPLLLADWIRPGAHVACMGTDTAGKQEVEPGLLARSAVFTDEVAQSVSIGEAKRAVKDGLVPAEAIIPIGAVIDGRHAGRTSEDQVTLFDGTGVGLQDLAVASRAAEKAAEKGLGSRVRL